MDLVEELVNVVGKKMLLLTKQNLYVLGKGAAQVRAMQLQSYFQPL